MNWRHYIHSNNPIAAAFLSKMGYTERERVQVKKEFLRMLVKMKINPAKMELINGFFETYLSLNESEEKELMEEIKQLDRDESEQILKLPNSWREKGILEGIQKGIQEGRKEGIQKGIQEGRKEGIQKGIQEGLKEGIQKGIQEGLKKGQQKGELEAQRKIALNLLKEGLPLELIARATNLDYAEIEKVRKLL
ncbi:hypothetical protein [Neobacillus soli]|uniref:hypothetical protein n=1 Tax=Neobacillus soli TaxID=220688 RepID=UPI0031454A74